PFAVAPHDLDQLVERSLTVALGVERQGQVEARLVVERIGGDLLLELADGPERGRLLGKLERGARGRYRRVVALALGDERQRLLGRLDRAGLYVAARQARQRLHVLRFLLQHVGIDFRGAGRITLGKRGLGGLELVFLLAADAVLDQPLDEGGDLALRQ